MHWIDKVVVAGVTLLGYGVGGVTGAGIGLLGVGVFLAIAYAWVGDD